MVATITRDELKAKLDRGDQFVLVETLPEAAYQQSHLPGAIYLPPDQLSETGAAGLARSGGRDRGLLCQSDLKRVGTGRT